MTLSEVVAIFRRGWWIIALVTVLGGLAGTLYGTSQPTTYSSTVHGYVVVNNSGTSGGDTFNASQAAQSRMASYAALATTPAVTAAVASTLKLDMNPQEVATHLAVSFPPGTLLLGITATAEQQQLATQLSAETLRQLQAQVATLETPAPGIPQWARVETVPEPTTVVRSAPATWTFIAGGIVGGLLVGVLGAYLYTSLRRRPRQPARREADTTTAVYTNGVARPALLLNGDDHAPPAHPDVSAHVAANGRDDGRHTRGAS